VGAVIINNTDYKLQCRFFGQNRILLFNKSATCFIYRFAGITVPIPRISKEEMIWLPYWSQILNLTMCY